MRPRTLTAVSLALLLAAPIRSHAQTTDLATLYDLGSLVIDTNGDSVPDLVNATLVLGDAPSVAETSAAAEIAARHQAELYVDVCQPQIPVEQERALPRLGQRVGQGDGEPSLADAPLLVHHREDATAPRPHRPPGC